LAEGPERLIKVFPTPVGWGSPAFLAPLMAGLQGLATRPFLSLRGGTPPAAPRQGAPPPGPPIGPPPLTEGSPAYWVPLVAGLLMWAARPLFFILGAHPPNPLGGGASPLHPPFARPRVLWVCRRFGSHSWWVDPSPAFARIFPALGWRPRPEAESLRSGKGLGII